MPSYKLSVVLIAILGILTLTAVLPTPAVAQTESTLYDFPGTEFSYTTYGLVFDSAGNLYGTSPYGGDYGLGEVFELSPTEGGDWTETTLHSFDTSSEFISFSNLIFDGAGRLFGTSSSDGTSGCGTVFALAKNAAGVWNEKVLHNFKSTNDGCFPLGGLLADNDGNLYGTTQTGGSDGEGTVFELSFKSGGFVEKILHSFSSRAGGQNPSGSLIMDAAGNLYGTTSSGGGGNCRCDGTVYELSPAGGGRWTERVLWNMPAYDDGADPNAGVVFDSVGNLYGTTVDGGGGVGAGVVFELSPAGGGAWSSKVIHSFEEGGEDGFNPRGGLIFDAGGNLYGTTFQGGVGTGAQGTVFKLSPAAGGVWSETILFSFIPTALDGYNPTSNLIFDSSGNLYGTTNTGGTGNGGTVFEITP